MTQVGSLASLIDRAREWAKALPKERRAEIRKCALERMVRSGLLPPGVDADPNMLEKFCTIEALEQMRREGAT